MTNIGLGTTAGTAGVASSQILVNGNKSDLLPSLHLVKVAQVNIFFVK